MFPTDTVVATPNPSAIQVSAATGVTGILAYGAQIIAAKYGVPPAVTITILSGLATIGTSLWHRLFGPKVPVSVPAKVA